MEHKISSKIAETVAWIGMTVNFIFGCIIFWIAYQNHSHATYLVAWHFIGGTFVWLLVLLHSRQKRIAEEEKLAHQLAGPALDASLFQGEEDSSSAQVRLRYFEKWAVPILTAMLGIAFLVGGILLFVAYIKEGSPARIEYSSLSAAFLAGFAFFSLLFSKYALGMANQPQWNLLRAGASYLFVNACFCFVCSVLVALTYLAWDWPEHYFAGLIPLFMAIIGMEMLLNLVLDIYRPRLPNQSWHPPYDSRFLNLCTGSKGFFRTLAHTLDYQFGFKISETWFYQFLEKAIVPLLLFMGLTLELFSCIVVVENFEQAIIERWGQPLPKTYMPGIHFKMPWPIEKVHYIPVKRIQSITIGFIEDHNAKTMIYTEQEHHHASEELFIVYDPAQTQTIEESKHPEETTSFTSVALLAINVRILYQIRAAEEDNPANLLDYLQHKDPQKVLECIGNREVTKFFSTTSIHDILGAERIKTYPILHQRIQKKCDEMKLGIKIVFVGVCVAHPPEVVAEAFEDVLKAEEEKESKILQAKRLAETMVHETKAEKIKIESEAEDFKNEIEKISKAEATAFENFMEAYQIGRDVYLYRKYLKILESEIPGKRLYIIANDGIEKETTIFNWEDRFTSDFLQLDLSEKKEEEK